LTPEQHWARCKPFIEDALAQNPGLETIEDVERAIERGTYFCWFGNNCAAITEICHYPNKRVLDIRHCGGDLNELLDRLEPAMCEFARENGCTAIMGSGRKGWERIGEKRGYRFAYVSCIKDLVN
jgi:hypothetical protein